MYNVHLTFQLMNQLESIDCVIDTDKDLILFLFNQKQYFHFNLFIFTVELTYLQTRTNTLILDFTS